MARRDYSEDLLIQAPTAELLEQTLGWQAVFAQDDEDFGEGSLLGRSKDTEVVLRREVLAALQRLHEGLQPSVMLVDIEMPGMNGLELLRRLRQEPRWQQLSVVMLTAHEAGPVSQQALDMGAQAYLTKPYSPQQLLAQVKRYAAAVVD